MIELTKEVPVPEPRIRNVYPYKVMEVGDSFFVPVEDVSSSNSIRQTIYASNRRRKPKFFRVVWDEDGVTEGYRVFRVK